MSGTGLLFWGENEDYGEVDQRVIADIMGGNGAFSALKVNNMRSETGMKRVLRELTRAAQAMEGKTAAYCAHGLERSATAIFAALYVTQGIAKSKAREAVLAAVEASFTCAQGGNEAWKQRKAAARELTERALGGGGFDALPEQFSSK